MNANEDLTSSDGTELTIPVTHDDRFPPPHGTSGIEDTDLPPTVPPSSTPRDPPPVLHQAHVAANISQDAKSDVTVTSQSDQTLAQPSGATQATWSWPNVSGSQLVPPTAFLFRRDGTPLTTAPQVVGQRNKTEDDTAFGQQGVPSEPNLGVTWPPAPDDTLNVTFTTTATSVTTSPRSVTSGGLHGDLDDMSLLSPAEEMIHIRNRLRTFKEHKQNLRFE